MIVCTGEEQSLDLPRTLVTDACSQFATEKLMTNMLHCASKEDRRPKRTSSIIGSRTLDKKMVQVARTAPSCRQPQQNLNFVLRSIARQKLEDQSITRSKVQPEDPQCNEPLQRAKAAAIRKLNE
ncbi:hypothetical protein KIN20_010813 [Parelaphostrongylus tenuis]|uniref:Uncharacterized protein n=1 Tax=Parelaphostrongylus tenuis TaxID=148309 RepID=A0AAD5MZF7_PARTN|nr:hypothetical protein KIN20_010813 [Parelaphostrongylus tenuis]